MTKGRATKADRTAIQAALVALQHGEWVAFKLPGDQPSKRIQYQRINAEAYRLWGAGSYRIISLVGEVRVVRGSVRPQTWPAIHRGFR